MTPSSDTFSLSSEEEKKQFCAGEKMKFSLEHK